MIPRVWKFMDTSVNSSEAVLAEATRGAREFVTSEERLEQTVPRVFSRMTSPQLTDLWIDWKGNKHIEPAASEIPPVFDGDAMTLYARCPKGRLPDTVELKCATAVGTNAWKLDIPRPAARDSVLPLLWARHRIQQLECEYVRTRQRLPLEPKRIVEEIARTLDVT